MSLEFTNIADKFHKEVEEFRKAVAEATSVEIIGFLASLPAPKASVEIVPELDPAPAEEIAEEVKVIPVVTEAYMAKPKAPRASKGRRNTLRNQIVRQLAGQKVTVDSVRKTVLRLDKDGLPKNPIYHSRHVITSILQQNREYFVKITGTQTYLVRTAEQAAKAGYADLAKALIYKSQPEGI